MNSFIQMQCKSMIISLETFQQACKLAVLKDDGKISKAEEKALRKITAAAKAFRSELEKI